MKQNGRTRQLNKCLRKKRYGSLAEARRFARYRAQATGIVHTAYECPVCYWFHLTTGGYVGQDKEIAPCPPTPRRLR
jgi:hypothetical protein